MASSSKTAVTLAVLGNSLLTVLKFVSFAVSGSGAMLSEALHSLADTGNQSLLWIGIRRSEAPADATFHYGHGGGRFLFALLSAVGIFVLGCGVTIYHGIHSLLHPPELELGWQIFAVLGVSIVVDGVVLAKAVGVANAQRGAVGLLRHVRQSTDPTLAAVLLEDTVACLGVIVAVVGVLLSYWTGSHLPDVFATFLIGAMMGLIAVWLGYMNRSLILGRALPAQVQREMTAYLEAQPSVERVSDVKSRIVGASRFKLKAEVDWCGRELAKGLAEWVEERVPVLDTAEKRRAFTLDFGERMTRAVAAEIDRIEIELKRRHPELEHIDFESD